MFGCEFERPENDCFGIAAPDALSREGSLFSPVNKTRAKKTTTKTV